MGATGAQGRHDGTRKQRGRPRARNAPTGLVRRNLLVDAQSLEQLRAVYEAKSESEAVRRAVELALLAHDGQALGERLAARGGPVDVYGRTSGRPRLPVHLNRAVDAIADDDPGAR